MYGTPQTHARQQRRAVILVVVLSLLGLFAVVALTFVLYADAAALAARVARDAESPPQADIDSEKLLSYFLGQFIYDLPDPDLHPQRATESSAYSALRGHSLGRSMFGYNSLGANPYPFNGVGRLFGLKTKWPKPTGAGHVDDFSLVNYQYFGLDDVLRDPERVNWTSPDPAAPGVAIRNNFTTNQAAGPFAGGWNVPYTAPDMNNIWLGAVQADGTVLARSFHRPATGRGAFDPTNPDTGFGSLSPANPNWYYRDDDPNAMNRRPYLKYQVLRPRPADHGRDAAGNFLFPAPEDDGGDVKNLTWAKGGNDSIWIDLGFPVMTAPNGKRFKPLFAAFILDLDNRINLNVAGNLRAQIAAPGAANGVRRVHVSHQGWGPWEINPGKLFPNPAPAPAPDAEWKNLLLGMQASATNPAQDGRYGQNFQATSRWGNNPALPGTAPQFYARVNYDAASIPGPAGGYGLPQAFALPTGQSTWPTFPNNPAPPPPPPPAPTPPNSFGDGDNTERMDHPLLYNPFLPGPGDRRLAHSNMEALLRYGETGSPMLTSDLFRLMPQAMGSVGNGLGQRDFLRQTVTSLSMNPNRPSVAPWVWHTPANGGIYTMPGTPPPALGRAPSPSGGPMTFPTPLLRSLVPGGAPVPGQPAVPQRFAANPDGNDFLGDDWRSQLAGLKRLNLNRPLPAYPPSNVDGTINYTNPATKAQFDFAHSQRIEFARAVYIRLWRAAGARAVGSPGFLPEEMHAHRWLAQLAVNIVDYIDEDDVMTSLDWTPGQFVLGTEVPRVVLNEIYAQYTSPTDPNAINPRTTVQVWAELHNTFRPDSRMRSPNEPPANGFQGGEARLRAGGVGASYGVYQILLAPQQTNLRVATNVLGQPDNMPAGLINIGDPLPTPAPGTSIPPFPIFKRCDDFGATQPPPANVSQDKTLIQPMDPSNNYAGDIGGNRGFYVVGPSDLPGTAPPAERAVTHASATRMQYEVDGIPPGNPADLQLKPPTVLLQRLAIPWLPPNPPLPAPGYTMPPPPPPPVDPNLPFNPYVTVDYAEGVHWNAAGGPTPPAVDSRTSMGKKQPYAGERNPATNVGQWFNAPALGLLGQPQHSFFRHNGIEPAPGPADPANLNQTLQIPFDWLVHLDRQLISVMELLHVSAFKPHELTQQFVRRETATLPDGSTPAVDLKFRHYAPWTDSSSRLYRAFEFLTTGPRMEALTSAPIRSTYTVTTTANVSAGSPSTAQLNLTYGLTPSGSLWTLEPGQTLIFGSGNTQEIVTILAVNHTTRQIAANFQNNHAMGTVVDLTYALADVDQRLPGQVNINTVNNVEVFRALADSKAQNDPERVNAFDETQVDAVFNAIVALRANRYLRGMAPGETTADPAGQYPTGLGRDDSFFFRAAATALDPVFFTGERAGNDGSWQSNPGAPTGTPQHPYLRTELMTKVFNHLTTRSNVFGVWLTVGFFEVVDPPPSPLPQGNRPPLLGREIGRAEGRHVRHRMFAIVDRTALMAMLNGFNGPPSATFDPRKNPSLVPYFSIID